MRNFIVILLILFFTCDLFGGEFKDTWTVGDTWKIKYDVLEGYNLKDDTDVGEEPSEFTYKYEVLEVSSSQTKISISDITDEAEGIVDKLYEAIFKKNESNLTYLSKVLCFHKGVEKTNASNVYGKNHWRPSIRDFGLYIIHDFPVLKEFQIDETIIVNEQAPEVDEDEKEDAEEESDYTGKFSAAITVENDVATIVFEDKENFESLLEHEKEKTIIKWDKGAKWWKEAEIFTGTKRQIKGTLIVTP